MFHALAQVLKDTFLVGEPTRLNLRQKTADTFTPLAAYHSGNFGAGTLNFLPRTKVDYAKEVGDGLGSSVLMSPIKWVQRTFPEAPIELTRQKGKEVEILENHPLIRLLSRPNPHYTGTALWSGTLFSWIVSGDAYWVKIRGQAGKQQRAWWENISGEVQELWYFPHWLMAPKYPQDGSVFISHYEYTTGGKKIEIPIENVVHFRNGIDPRDARHGLSLIASELREIFTDDEASNFIAALLNNMGVPGMIVAPDFSAGIPQNVSPDDLETMKQYIKQQFSGDRRGDPMVIKAPWKISPFGFNPAQLQVSQLRDVAEERICAAIGIPPSVVQFGTGLQQTKVGATIKEEIGLAWKQCIIPMQGLMAEQIDMSLVPEFESKPDAVKTRFNHHAVAALQENKKDTAEAMNIGIQGGWVKVAEGRRALGLDATPEDEIYLRSLSVIETTGEIIDIEARDVEDEPKTRIRKLLVSRKLLQSAGPARPTQAQKRLMVRLNREAIALGETFETELLQFFAKMGRAIADAAMDILEPDKPKASAEDELTATSILSRVEIETLKRTLGEIGGAHYLRVAKQTYKSIEAVMGLAVDLPDARQVEIVQRGGKQMGLIDLDNQTRQRLFRELATGRELGEGPIELARRIRENVPAGKWGTASTRAKTIARTETLNAQRQSVLEASRDAENVSSVMVFDGRLPTSDDDCVERNGKIISIEEAWGLDEHPNGTLSWVPVITGANE